MTTAAATSVGAPAYGREQLEAAVDQALSDFTVHRRKLLTRPLTPCLERLRPKLLARSIPGVPIMEVVGAAAIETLGDLAARIRDIRAHVVRQEAAVRVALDVPTRDDLILGTAEYLGASKAKLKEDRKALRRWLDWDAMKERADAEVRFLMRQQQAMVMLAGGAFARVPEGTDLALLLERTGYAAGAAEAFNKPTPPLIEREWALGVRRIVEARHRPGGPPPLPDALHQAVTRKAMNPASDIWCQCDCASAWVRLDPEGAREAARRRLADPKAERPDNLFFRRHVVEDIARVLPEEDALILLRTALGSVEPSAHVRQGTILALGWPSSREALTLLEENVILSLQREPVSQVRAAVPIALHERLRAAADPVPILAAFKEFFRVEKDPLPLRVGLNRLGEAFEEMIPAGRLPAVEAENAALDLLRSGTERGWPLASRRQAEELLERARVAAMPEFRAFREDVVPRLWDMDPGTEIDLLTGAPLEAMRLGALLAWLSRRTEGLYARPLGEGRWRIRVGMKRVFKLWRFLFESVRPAPDKRQAFSHVTGREVEGVVRAHSALMGEESPTKVPGEPIKIPAEGGWRRFLPPVDDFLDALAQGTLRVFSSEGVATIVPPAERKAAKAAYWTITKKYGEIFALREQCRLDNPEVDPSAFVNRFRGLGFEVGWMPYAPAGLGTADAYYAEPKKAQEEADGVA